MDTLGQVTCASTHALADVSTQKRPATAPFCARQVDVASGQRSDGGNGPLMIRKLYKNHDLI